MFWGHIRPLISMASLGNGKVDFGGQGKQVESIEAETAKKSFHSFAQGTISILLKANGKNWKNIENVEHQVPSYLIGSR